jgi:uncharacterized membrane protein YfcA
MLLAVLGLLGIRDLHERNGLKNLVAASVNGVAAVLFIWRASINWNDAALLGAGALAGGYAGAHFAQRLGRGLIRRVVIGIGLVLTAWYFVQTH